MKRIFFSVIILLIVSGCESIPEIKKIKKIDINQSSIIFNSHPAGATISYGSEIWGQAPQKRIWTLNKGQAQANSGNVTATWLSGATATTFFNLVAGHEGAYTFQRPQGVAGIDVDVNWAIHLQQMQNQADIAMDQMIIQNQGNQIQQMQLMQNILNQGNKK